MMRSGGHRVRVLVAGAALLAVALGLSGCLFRSPGVRFYTLAPVEGFKIRGTEDIAVQVGPVVLPRHLGRPQIVTRDGEREIHADAFSRWAGGPESVILRVLGANLAQRLGTQRVALSTSEPPFPIAYGVTLEFNELVRWKKKFIMDARFTIHEVGEELRAVETIQLELDAGRKIDGTIQAHEEAMGKLADAIAERIGAIVREKTATGQYGAPINATP